MTEFIAKKMKHARYKLIKDGTYFGRIIGIRGVWANAKNLEDCRTELQEVLEEWLLLKLQCGERIEGMMVPAPRHESFVHNRSR